MVLGFFPGDALPGLNCSSLRFLGQFAFTPAFRKWNACLNSGQVIEFELQSGERPGHCRTFHFSEHVIWPYILQNSSHCFCQQWYQCTQVSQHLWQPHMTKIQHPNHQVPQMRGVRWFLGSSVKTPPFALSITLVQAHLGLIHHTLFQERFGGFRGF